MASSMNRIGNNPFFRPTGGGTNNQGLTGKQLQDFMKQPLRSWEQESLRQPFRPALERRIPSPVPKIPFQLQRQVQSRAWDIATRIVKTGTRLHPFRMVFQWVLEWLFDWITRKLARRGNNMGWSLVASCGSPPTPVEPDRYLGHALYPPPAIDYTQTTTCLTGQAIAPSYPYSLQSFAPGIRTAKKHVVYSSVPQRATITELWTRPGSYKPSIWDFPNLQYDNPPKVEPPKRVRPHLKEDWYSAVDTTIPPNEQKERETDTPPAVKERQDTTEVRINNRLQTQTVRLQRTRRPTRSREKEQKFQGTSALTRAVFGWLARNKERVTELDDLLDIFIDSMPEDIQKQMPKRNGRGTPDLKMKFIYDNFDKVDWNKFSDEFVKNWVEDKVVGTGIAGSDKAAKARGETNTIGSRNWLHSSTKGKMPWFPS